MILASVERAVEEGLRMETFAGPVRQEFLEIGALVVPSGQVAAGDPGFVEDIQGVGVALKPGRYPVVLSLLSYPDKDQRIAAARVVVGTGKVARWEEARSGAYGVDSGLGCFVDAQAARDLAGRGPKALEAFWRKLDTAVARNEAPTRAWGSVVVEEKSGANLVAFSSGFGDGGYWSYVGYDARGGLVCLLTDFGLLLSEEEIEAMDDEVEEEE